MHKIKTLFDISPEPEASEPQDNRITLNEITLLSKMQAVTRYNLGASSIRRVAKDCGALVHIGKRVVYHRQTLDDFLKTLPSRKGGTNHG